MRLAATRRGCCESLKMKPYPYYSAGGRRVPAPVNTVAPVASGTPGIGNLLSSTDGTWLGAPTFTYQWTRSGAPIGGETANTYAQVAADIGHSIVCEVTGTNAGGSATANSNSITWTVDLPGSLSLDLDPAVGVTEAAGLVSSWADPTSGNAATEATVAYQPTEVLGGGPSGQDAIDFATAASARKLKTGPIGLGSAVTVCVVVQTPPAGLNSYICDGGTADASRMIRRINNDFQMFAGSGIIIPAPAENTWVYLIAVFNGASSKFSLNGAAPVLGNPGAGASTGHTIGAPGGASGTNPTFGCRKRIGRHLVYNQALSDAHVANVAAYLANWMAGAV